MTTRNRLIAYLVIFVWGINFYFMKLSLNDVSPMVLGMLRFTCLLFPAIFFIKRPKVKWYWLFAYGVTISFGQFGLIFLALAIGFPTSIMALIQQAQLFFTVIIVTILWREPIKLNQILSMLIASIGLGLISIGQYQEKLPMFGVLLVLLSALCWAIGNVIVKKIGQVNSLSLVVWGNLSSLILFTITAIILLGSHEITRQIYHMSISGWIGVFFMAYIASLIGYGGWGRLLSIYPASVVLPLTLYVPVIALIVAWVFMQETLSIWHWLGIAIIMGALLVQNFAKKLLINGQ